MSDSPNTPAASSPASAETSTRVSHRRWRRWWTIALLALCATTLLAIRSYGHTVRAEHLADEIRQTGGDVILRRPIWTELLLHIYWPATPWSKGTYVELAPSIAPQWLKERDYLADLPIASLNVLDAPHLGSALPTLVAEHRLVHLNAFRTTGADQIASALAPNESLRTLFLQDSDLTDVGFRLLPLETIEELDVSGTQATTEGLRELRRARRLRSISLDGGQATAEIFAILEQTAKSYELGLIGSDVTDDTLQKLILELERYPALQLQYVALDQTSATESGIEASRRALQSVWFTTGR